MWFLVPYYKSSQVQLIKIWTSNLQTQTWGWPRTSPGSLCCRLRQDSSQKERAEADQAGTFTNWPTPGPRGATSTFGIAPQQSQEFSSSKQPLRRVSHKTIVSSETAFIKRCVFAKAFCRLSSKIEKPTNSTSIHFNYIHLGNYHTHSLYLPSFSSFPVGCVSLQFLDGGKKSLFSYFLFCCWQECTVIKS